MKMAKLKKALAAILSLVLIFSAVNLDAIKAQAEGYQIKFRAATNDLADKVTVHYSVDEGAGMTITGSGWTVSDKISDSSGDYYEYYGNFTGLDTGKSVSFDIFCSDGASFDSVAGVEGFVGASKLTPTDNVYTDTYTGANYISFRVGAGGPPVAGGVEITFDGWTSGQTITYTIGEGVDAKTVTVTLPAEKAIVDGKVELGFSDEIAVTGFDPDTMKVVLVASDGFNVTLGVIDGKTSLDKKSNEGGLPSALTFRVEAKTGGSEGGPGGGLEGGPEREPEGEPDVIDITVNGTPHSDVKDGDVIKGDFNLDDLTYSITKVNGTALTNVGNKSGVKDEAGRDVLEVQVKAKTDSSLTLALIYHSEDDKVNPGQPGFYIKNLTFAKEGFVGVALDIGKIPDMYSDTVYSSVVDITGTTQAAPAKTAAYYGSEEIDLASVDAGKAITKVEVAAGTNPGAVTITGSKVKFNSHFYASIPLVVTLNDGAKGYLQVDRLGLDLGAYNKDAGTLHGSQPGLSLAGVSGTDEKNVVATFYYDAASTYTDYDIVANITYANGKTETKVVKGFGEKECVDHDLKGGDYLVWSGAKEDTPVSVSVTAVKAGATTGSTFGGACFGAGAGLTKSFVE